jgi:hypothetical protein
MWVVMTYFEQTEQTMKNLIIACALASIQTQYLPNASYDLLSGIQQVIVDAHVITLCYIWSEVGSYE